MKPSLLPLLLGMTALACTERFEEKGPGASKSSYVEPPAPTEGGVPASSAGPGGESSAASPSREAGSGLPSGGGGGEANEADGSAPEAGGGEASGAGDGSGGGDTSTVAPIFAESCEAPEPLEQPEPGCEEAPYYAVVIDPTRPLGALMRNEGVAINDFGQVTGTYNPGSDLEEWAPWRWEDGSTTIITHPEAAFGHARGINDSGAVLATFRIAGEPRYFVDEGGLLAEVQGLSPHALNDRGDLAGSSGGLAAVRVDGEIATLPLISSSVARSINNRREVVGSFEADELFNTRAFLYRCGEVLDLGTLGGSSSTALDLNERGQVVGVSRDATGRESVFSSQDGVMTALFAYDASAQVAVNERGEVVNGQHLASNGRTYVLKDLVAHESCWTQLWGSDINDHGDIVGWGRACSPNPAEPVDFAPAVVITQRPERYRAP